MQGKLQEEAAGRSEAGGVGFDILKLNVGSDLLTVSPGQYQPVYYVSKTFEKRRTTAGLQHLG